MFGGVWRTKSNIKDGTSCENSSILDSTGFCICLFVSNVKEMPIKDGNILRMVFSFPCVPYAIKSEEQIYGVTFNVSQTYGGFNQAILPRGGSRTAATSKMEYFVIIVKPLTILTKSSTLDAAAVLDLPLLLHLEINLEHFH